MEEANSLLGVGGRVSRVHWIRKEEGGICFSSNKIVRGLPGLNGPRKSARMASSLFLISTNAVEAVFLA